MRLLLLRCVEWEDESKVRVGKGLKRQWQLPILMYATIVLFTWGSEECLEAVNWT